MPVSKTTVFVLSSGMKPYFRSRLFMIWIRRLLWQTIQQDDGMRMATLSTHVNIVASSEGWRAVAEAVDVEIGGRM